MSNYLLDTNYLIHLSKNQSDPNRQAVLTEIRNILTNDDALLFITPLIAYEVLRGVEWVNDAQLNTLKSILEQFEMLDINMEISDLAINLYRYDVYKNQHTNKNFEKRKFDIFHFATAKIHNLEMLSKDTDIIGIKNLYNEMIQAQNN